MKVIQIGATYTGAQEKLEYSIHKYLQRNEYDSYILYAYGDSNDSQIIKYETRLANVIRRGIYKYLAKSPRCAFFSTIQLIKNISRIKPDIVHLHVLHHGYIDYVLLFHYLAKKKIPVVYTMHDMWAFTGGCYYYTEVACNAYTSDCSNCPKNSSSLDCSSKKTKYYLNLKIKLYEDLNKIIFVAVSDWVLEELKKSKLNKYSLCKVWNALDPDSYRDIDTSDNAGEGTIFASTGVFKIIGVANVWTEQKGIFRFIELAQLLGDKYQFALVGNISKQLRKISPPNILYKGPINDKRELAKCYSQADIHISMSTEETFGYTFVEAAFCGTKSIGFDCTAISSVIKKVKGFVVPKDDLQAVSALVIRLNETRRICKLTEVEKIEIYNQFSSKKMAEEYCRIYHDLCEQK